MDILTQLQWVDYLIIIVIIFYAIEGYLSGAVQALFDLIKFVLSFILGLRFYTLAGGIFISFFHLTEGIARASGFFVIIVVSELLLSLLFRRFLFRFSIISHPFFRKIDSITGFLFGGLSGILFTMILLSLLVTLPVSSVVQKNLQPSELAKLLISQSRLLQNQIYGVFGEAASDTVKFLTVKPDSNATVMLRFTAQGTIDEESEQEMIGMVNKERTNRNISRLVPDDTLRTVARAHGQDMLMHGYFSHYTLDGLSPFDRMDKARIIYQYAGENLAFSPSVDLAMEGLMNSPGHRENILYTHFHKIGVGVLDAGLYGKMFVQEFTD